jgi:hypothetical protein
MVLIYIFDNDYRTLAYTEQYKGSLKEAEEYCTRMSWFGETYFIPGFVKDNKKLRRHA